METNERIPSPEEQEKPRVEQPESEKNAETERQFNAAFDTVNAANEALRGNRPEHVPEANIVRTKLEKLKRVLVRVGLLAVGTMGAAQMAAHYDDSAPGARDGNAEAKQLPEPKEMVTEVPDETPEMVVAPAPDVDTHTSQEKLAKVVTEGIAHILREEQMTEEEKAMVDRERVQVREEQVAAYEDERRNHAETIAEAEMMTALDEMTPEMLKDSELLGKELRERLEAQCPWDGSGGCSTREALDHAKMLMDQIGMDFAKTDPEKAYAMVTALSSQDGKTGIDVALAAKNPDLMHRALTEALGGDLASDPEGTMLARALKGRFEKLPDLYGQMPPEDQQMVQRGIDSRLQFTKEQSTLLLQGMDEEGDNTLMLMTTSELMEESRKLEELKGTLK